MIAVPYLSQWDGDAHLSRGDCGIVCAAMLCRWKGQPVTPDGLLRAAHLPVGRHAYSFNEIILAAAAGGVKLRAQASSDWLALRTELDAGRPVISLIRYGELSGNLDDFDGSHFVVVCGYDADSVIICDPDYWSPRRADGDHRRVPLKEFRAAIGDALRATGNKPFQALILA